MPMLPLVMGIVNVTPDSFSGDGLAGNFGKAVDQAARMVAEGAAIIDVGGESTRPGAKAISIDEEQDRVQPVLEALKERFQVKLSVDTRHFEVAREAIRNGATILNDISGGADRRMLKLARENKCTYLFMHMQGTPETMQAAPTYPRGVVTEVLEALRATILAAELPKEQIWVDPGIGFGKTLEHNLALLKDLRQFEALGERIVIGTSRKSFLGKILGTNDVADRLEATIASNLAARAEGASVFRVHDVGAMVKALKTWEAINAGK